MSEQPATYLGDGLYAEFDGWQFRLFASDGVRVTNEVFLDEHMIASFARFVDACTAPPKPNQKDP